MTRLRLLVLLTGLALVLTGCGIQPQSQPTAIVVPTSTGSPARGADNGGPRQVTIYLVRQQRLVAVERRAQDVSFANMIDLLLAGPLTSEASDGVTSSVPPQSLRPVVADTTSGVAYVEATRAFTEVSGANQLLAVAQLVWTVTEHPSTERVSITVDGEPLEVPTDAGLSRVPVSRHQFRSVAPVPPTSEGS